MIAPAKSRSLVTLSNPEIDVRSLFLSEYLPRKRNLEPTTERKMHHELNRWERLSKNPPVELIDSAAFDAARDSGLEKGLSPDTIETTIGTVLTVLRHAKKRGVLLEVPGEGEKLQRTTRRRYVPPVNQLDRLYLHTAVAKWPRFREIRTDDFWKSWIVCSYFTGLRLSDQMHVLAWEGVTEDSVAVEANKTGKFHVFPYPSVFRRHLDRLRVLADPRVFPVSKSPHLVRREMKRISEAAGLPKPILPHALRRLAATQWQKAKWGAGQTLLGQTLGVADKYIAPAILQEAVRLLDIPPAFLTQEEAAERAAGREALLGHFDRLDEAAQAIVAELIAKLIK